MFCPKCGKENAENVKFCVGCGSALSGTPTVQPVVKNRLHCPNCRSTSITITTESSVTGGVTTHHGGFSSTHMSNEHRNFWVCSDCGTKFRNIQSLEEEIHRYRNTPMIFVVLMVISVALFIYMYLKIQSDTFGFLLTFYCFGAAIAAIVFGGLALYYRNNLKKLRKELAYLKVNCFN